MNYSFTVGLVLQGIYFLGGFSGDIYSGGFFRWNFFLGDIFPGFFSGGLFSCSAFRYLFIFKEALYVTKRGSYLHCFDIF